MWAPTPDEWQRLEPLVDELLDAAPGARQALLDRSFSTSPELRAWAERLVEGASDDGWLTHVSPALVSGAFRSTDAANDPLQPGTRIGPFRLEREIGRGGMGRVYLAQRDEGTFAQRVALKVIASTRMSPELQRRFLAEQRALARLDHPNVARIVDGGVHDGVPWFAMEYVDGVRLDEWCDTQHLDLRARVALLVAVCEAVQSAHQALVIHRDLKPSNILVTAEGKVRLLDFGVAKLLDRDADAPDETQADDLPFTPEYAAPEQWRRETATTATDCYALGALLYQLLCGERPHALHGRPRHEWTRIVLEEVPQALSDAVTDKAASARGTSLDALRRALRGDLDAITLTALHKDPTRRYATARELAADLQRYLRAEPVSARADTWGYRTSRFVRRHRVAVAAGVAVTLALAGGVITTTWQARRARAAADEAVAVSSFLRSVFAEASPLLARGDSVTAGEMLQRAAAGVDSMFPGRPDLRVRMLLTVAEIDRDLGAYARGDTIVRRALRIADSMGTRDLTVVGARAMAAEMARVQGNFARADTLFTSSIELARSIGAPDTTMARLRGAQGHLYYRSGKHEEAAVAYQAALDLGGALGPLFIATNLGSLGSALDDLQRDDAADSMYARAITLYRAAGLEGHPDYLTALGNRANLLSAQWALDSARALQEILLPALQQVNPEGHDRVLIAESNLAFTRLRQGELAAAESGFVRAHAMGLRLHGPRHPLSLIPLNNIGRARYLSGRAVAAESVYRASLGHLRAASAATSATATTAWIWLGKSLGAQRRWPEALAALDSAAASVQAREPGGVPPAEYGVARSEVLWGAGRVEDAERELRPVLDRVRRNLTARDVGVADAAMLLARIVQARRGTVPDSTRVAEVRALANEAWERYRALPSYARQAAQAESLGKAP